MTQQPEDALARLTVPAYLLAAVFFFLPFVDLMVAVAPAPTRGVAWRFGALGLLSGGLFYPALALVLALAIAIVRGHPTVRRLVGIVAALFCAALLIATIVFVLDALQMRAQVQEAARSRFALASGYALAKLLIFSVLTAVIAWASLRKTPQPVPMVPVVQKGPRQAPPIPRPAIDQE